MPNRIIKESINESRSLASLSVFSQDMYKRLITYADDYGRFNVDPEMMVARLYPRELGVIEPCEIVDGLSDLVGIGKISIYTCTARPADIYGHFPNWGEHQRIRNSKIKNPEPEHDVNDWYLRRFVPIDLKAQIFQRDKCKCQTCGADHYLGDEINIRKQMKLLSGVFHIDHIVPVNQGGRATIENLRLLCAKCNLKRPRIISIDDLLNEMTICTDSPRIAASSSEMRPNPIQSNPESNPILSPPAVPAVVDGGKKYKFEEQDMKCAQWMFDQIKIIAPHAKEPNWESWANEIRLMREQDHREMKYIVGVFKWANKDPFWAPNIMSPSKLRKQFDQLLVKAKSQSTGSTGSAMERKMAINELKTDLALDSLLDASPEELHALGLGDHDETDRD